MMPTRASPLRALAPSAACWRARSPTACRGLTLACVAARDRAKAQAWLDQEGIACPLVELEAIPGACRPRGRMRAGRRVAGYLPADAGGRQARDGAELRRAAAAARPDRTRRAQGGQIIVPTGALLGLDAVTAAAEGVIHSVRMMTRKPPAGLAGRALSRREQHLGRGAERGEAGVLRQRRARPPPASRPMSTWSPRSRSPASVPTGP